MQWPFLRAIFAGLLRATRSWILARLIGTYYVVLLTTKKAYIHGKRPFSNDIIMEGFWSLKEHFKEPEKWDWMEILRWNQIPDAQKYLQEKGEPHTKPQLENTKNNLIPDK
jgi:hypothetical protein